MAKQPRVWDGSQWQELAVTLPDLSNYSTTTQMNTAIDSAKGLVLVTSATIGSSVASVTVNNAFSSTYDNYRVVISGGSASSDGNIYVRLGSTATNYYEWKVYGLYSSNSVYGEAGSNITQILAGRTSSGGNHSIMDICSPNLAARTFFSTTGVNGSSSSLILYNGGFLDNSTQYTSFTLTTQNGTMTGGTIRVYGYRNS